jgi:hypothetical protein
MSKRWTFEEDLFLAKHFEAVGDRVGDHDLGRPKGSATKRVAALKEMGVWEVLHDHLQQEFDHLAVYMFKTGRRADLEMLCMTHVKAPYDWEEQFGFITYETPESRENHLNLLAEMAGVDRSKETAASA